MDGLICIADGGSTKSAWRVIQGNKIIHAYSTEGYNPYFMSRKEILRSLQEQTPALYPVDTVSQVYYYGAGCSNDDKCKIVQNAMQNYFPNAQVIVHHDLLASARALCGHQPGFAAILGTGMNTCTYDGKEITLNVDSLGYFLGDEGSAAYMSKKLLKDYLRGLLPVELKTAFSNTFHVGYEEILEALYHKPLPNRFLASFAPFLHEHIDHPYCIHLVTQSFRDFFEFVVSKYPDYQDQTFHCVGSIGYHFNEILRSVCKEWGMTVGKIIQSPIDDLVQYHLSTPV